MNYELVAGDLSPLDPAPRRQLFAGVVRLPDSVRYLIPRQAEAALPSPMHPVPVLISGSPHPPAATSTEAVHLFLGSGDLAGQARGWITQPDGTLHALDCLTVLTAGLPSFSLTPAHRTAPRGHDIALLGELPQSAAVATLLAHSGVARSLALVDHSRLSREHLPGTLFATDAQLGLTGAEFLALTLRDHCVTHAVSARPQQTRALDAIRSATLLVSATANAATRRIAGFLAQAYLLPWLDIAFASPDEAELSLLLPDSCLLCARVADHIHKPVGLSFLYAAASHGLRLLEDLLASRLTGTAKVRLHYEPNGRFHAALTSESESQRHCPLCRLAGSGDAALSSYFIVEGMA